MANVLCIMGESGSGKTTSMRNLDPATTCYIDCDKKGLSWKGWKKQYNSEAKNYLRTDDKDMVLKALVEINKNRQEVKTVVIDTLNGIMVGDEMRRMKEKGYDKWADLAASVYNILDCALVMRDDLTVIFTAHIQVDREENGYMLTHLKTNGKKLEKIQLETKFPVVLLARCIDGEYIFETQAANSTAKSPMGMLSDFRIPNDIKAVIEAMEEYYG